MQATVTEEYFLEEGFAIFSLRSFKDSKLARQSILKLEMWANAQCHGWSPCRIQVAPSVQRRKVWLTPTTRCRAVTLPRRETS